MAIHSLASIFNSCTVLYCPEITNVNNEITNNGTDNVIVNKTFSGSTVGTTDSNGRIAISWGTTAVGDKFINNPVPFVCAGDTTGETISVIFNTLTKTGCTVQINNNGTPVASGLTRRINWIVSGY